MTSTQDEPWFLGLEERRRAVGRAKENLRRGAAKARVRAGAEAAKPIPDQPQPNPEPAERPLTQVAQACQAAGVPYRPRRPANRPSEAILLKRRRVLSQLLAQGLPDEDIVQLALDPKLELAFATPAAVLKAIARCKDSWASQDAEQQPRLKGAATRRILDHISKAKAQSKWAPVAQLEHLLAGIQGTLAPIRIEVDTTEAQRHALAGAIATMTPAHVLELAAKQRMLEQADVAHLLPARPPALNAQQVEAIAVEELAKAGV